MSKPYSEDDFSTLITQDRNWRIKEISDLKGAIKGADASLQRVLLRALVAVCYAHWEGYVKFAARKYMEHVALRKFQFTQLDKQFLRNYFLPRLAALSVSKTSITERCALVDEVLSSSGQQFRRVNDDLINTKSNLNFEVFADVCIVCGLPADSFSNKATFIDVILLKRRNAIAHGEETLVAIGELDDITVEVIGLMRSFGDLLENHVYTQTYRAA
ncbi:hypothetical protein J7E49_26130 [Variovorax paradoxus]|nr:hypothetical protein [Variovorax paradoxus]